MWYTRVGCLTCCMSVCTFTVPKTQFGILFDSGQRLHKPRFQNDVGGAQLVGVLLPFFLRELEDSQQQRIAMTVYHVLLLHIIDILSLRIAVLVVRSLVFVLWPARCHFASASTQRGCWLRDVDLEQRAQRISMFYLRVVSGAIGVGK